MVPKPEEYKAKSRREQDAQREAAVKRKLKEWRCCIDGEEVEVEDLEKGKKRIHQNCEIWRPEKRQRLSSHLGQDVIGTTEGIYQPMREEARYLDVRNIKTSHKRAG